MIDAHARRGGKQGEKLGARTDAQSGVCIGLRQDWQPEQALRFTLTTRNRSSAARIAHRFRLDAAAPTAVCRRHRGAPRHLVLTGRRQQSL
jgi:hypothetical protein